MANHFLPAVICTVLRVMWRINEVSLANLQCGERIGVDVPGRFKTKRRPEIGSHGNPHIEFTLKAAGMEGKTAFNADGPGSMPLRQRPPRPCKDQPRLRNQKRFS